MIRLMGRLSVLLTVAPLIGIGLLLAFPPKDPFGGETPTLGALFMQTGLIKLFWNSMFISVSSAGLRLYLVVGWLGWSTEDLCWQETLIGLSLILLATPSYILAGTLASRINEIVGPSFQFEGLYASIVCLT